MYMCMYVYICICIYIYVCICMCVYVYMYVYILITDFMNVFMSSRKTITTKHNHLFLFIYFSPTFVFPTATFPYE